MAKEKKAATNKSVRKGFNRIEAAPTPFWTPNDEESGHPNPLIAIYLGTRNLPARGKFQAQDVIDCEEQETGAQYTVSVKGNLPGLLRSAKLGVGQTFLVEWIELQKPTAEMPHGMNVYDLQVEA